MDREKLLEDLHEILWHFPIGMSNWDKIVDIVLNSQLRREEDRAIFTACLLAAAKRGEDEEKRNG